jgi:hypothetical protein
MGGSQENRLVEKFSVHDKITQSSAFDQAIAPIVGLVHMGSQLAMIRTRLVSCKERLIPAIHVICHPVI